MTDFRFDGKTVVITGAGGALGRAHALAFAARGAQVVVNDLGGDAHGTGQGISAADRVVEEIRAAGGQAIANYDSVSNMDGAQRIIQAAVDHFGGVQVLVNNAGILRDVSFQKMTEDDWDQVMQVHVKGAFCITKAAWPHFRAQQYGRVIMTSSASGLYGNFGQSNYAAAKLALVGFAQTLAMEGAKYQIHTNTIAPIAASRMTLGVLPEETLAQLKPEAVSPLVVYLCSAACRENGATFEVGAGRFFRVRWLRGTGYHSTSAQDVSGVEALHEHWSQVNDLSNGSFPSSMLESTQALLTQG